jgi:hypothetical protein
VPGMPPRKTKKHGKNEQNRVEKGMLSVRCMENACASSTWCACFINYSSAADTEGSEETVDDIFAALAANKAGKSKNSKVIASDTEKESKKPKKKSPSSTLDLYNDVTGEKTAKKRRVVDGFKIYTEEELQIGQGGDTADCPFDCKCCF